MTRWSVELSHAARALARRPGFSAAAIALLGVAIGVNVAIFSLVQAVLLRPLPYTEPDRLVALSSEGRDRAQQPFSHSRLLRPREKGTRRSPGWRPTGPGART